MAVTIAFRENKYGEDMLKTLNHLRKEKKWSDFVIETSSGLVPVHRVVLAAAQNLHLQSQCFPLGEVSTFSLTDFSKHIVEIFVSYLYTGEVRLENGFEIREFIELCKVLKFTSLLKHVEFQQFKNTRDENAKKGTVEKSLGQPEDFLITEQLSEKTPHPVFLTYTENCDGKLIVKNISDSSVVQCNIIKYENSEKDNANSQSENSELLNDSSARNDSTFEEIVVKEEVMDNDSDNVMDNESDKEDYQLYPDNMSENSDDSDTKKCTSELAKDRNTGLKTEKNHKHFTRSIVKNGAKKTVSSALGSERQVPEVDQSMEVDNVNEVKEENVQSQDNSKEKLNKGVTFGKSKSLLSTNTVFVRLPEKDCFEIMCFPKKAFPSNDEPKVIFSESKKACIKKPHESFACGQCHYTTYSKYSLKRHVAGHSNPFSSLYQPEYSGTDSHLETKNSEKIICEKCGIIFESKFGYTLHNKSKHTLEFKYKCKFCGKGFNQSKQFHYHQASHEIRTVHKCLFCHTEFMSHDLLKDHLENCSKIDKDSIICKFCQASFKKQIYLRHHIQGKHEEARHECNQCGKKFRWRSSLKAHLTKVHSVVSRKNLQLNYIFN